jgi:hypothetical protein
MGCTRIKLKLKIKAPINLVGDTSVTAQIAAALKNINKRGV